MQIVEFHVLRIEGNGVFAILRGLEIDRHLVCRDVARNVCTDVNVGHGIFLAALRDADVGAWITEMELAQPLSLAEAHNGVVDGGRRTACVGLLLRNRDVQHALVGSGGGSRLAEGDAFVSVHFHDNAMARRDGGL